MQPHEEQKKENSVKEIIKFIVVAGILIFILRTYIANPFIVKGASMEPTFHNNNYLIVDQLSYKLKDPSRGDVIVLRSTRNRDFLIKRIIGLPGEKVSMREGKITITNTENPDGIVIPDDHVEPKRQTNQTFTFSLGPTEYFVMGDNRIESSDSREWGPLERDHIVGRPFLRLYPFSQIDVFPGM